MIVVCKNGYNAAAWFDETLLLFGYHTCKDLNSDAYFAQ